MKTQDKSKEINVINDKKVQKLLNYLKEVANIVSLETDNGTKLLLQEYERIKYISNKTVLYNYLYKELKRSSNEEEYKKLIFPFGLNNSQMQAVYRAMNNKISIIQGPPGTGKTQTILNIIANCIMRNKTVAVVCNNNAATDNVFEKLEYYGLDFLCAKLGKKENIEKFIQNQTGSYPEFTENISLNEETKLNNEIITLNEKLPQMYKIENEIKKLEFELKELQLEQRYFENYERDKLKGTLKLRKERTISSNDVLKLKVEYDIKQKVTLSLMMKSWIYFGIGKYSDYRKPKFDLGLYYSRLFYILKEAELKKKLNQKKAQVASFKLKYKTKVLIDSSNILLREKLRKKYEGNSDRKIYTEKEIVKTGTSFNNEYPVIFSTTYSVKKSINSEHIYDYIIIDEASQVDLLTGILALSCAKNIVVVGDTKQLPNIIKYYDRVKIDKLTEEYSIEDSYDYSHSFLEAILKAMPNVPQTLLKEHYRCHPKIIEFCNKKFYDGQLVISTKDNNEADILKIYKTSPRKSC